MKYDYINDIEDAIEAIEQLLEWDVTLDKSLLTFKKFMNEHNLGCHPYGYSRCLLVIYAAVLSEKTGLPQDRIEHIIETDDGMDIPQINYSLPPETLKTVFLMATGKEE